MTNLEKIVDSCQFLLNNYPTAESAKNYLNTRLTLESQNKWKFGYFPDTDNLSVLTDLVEEKVLKDNKLLAEGIIEDSFAPRRIWKNFFEHHPLVMPFRDSYGSTVALVGRTLLNEEIRQSQKIIKYKNTIFKKGNHLFGLFENKKHILEQKYVFVVEGQFDVIKAGEIGLHNIVALGNSCMTSYQLFLISRYSNNIRLLLDNDEAGQKGRAQIISKFGQYANIQNFYLPEECKDIDECITKNNIRHWTELPFIVKD